MSEQFFGKYRGKVAFNVDPEQIGRVQVTVPAIFGDGRLCWALPSVPYAGPNVGLFLVPPVGANVWVEFEGGDPDSPIYSGCFWGRGETPARPAVAAMKILKTDGITLRLNDLPGAGGLEIEVGPPVVPLPLKLTLNQGGIELSCGRANVKLSQVSVSLNQGALEVI